MVRISAGSYDLNKWLYGGYETDIITTIYGPAGSGKTNFCLLAAVSQAQKGNKVLFIDTEGGFSVERVKQITKDHFGLIIVDGMTMLYRLDFGEARGKSVDELQDVNSELARQMRTLAEIARKNNLPIVVTNQVYGWNDETRMDAGDILQYWSKCLIELTSENGKRTANLRKHRSLPEKKLDFQIVHEGIKKRGWL